MASVNDGDDAQRRLERQALRNVRDLVDKLEHQEAHPLRVIFPGIVALLVVVGAIGAAVLWSQWSAPGVEVRSPPDRLSDVAKNNPQLAGYIAAHVAKVESFANANPPRAFRGWQGDVRLTTVIRSDGSVQEVTVAKGGIIPLGDAMAEVVRAAAPFPPFSAFGIKDTEVLHITRTYRIARKTK